VGALLVVDGTAQPPSSPLGDRLAETARARGWSVACTQLGPAADPFPVILGARRLVRASPAQAPVIVLLGSDAEQSRVVGALVVAGLRPRVRLALHIRAAGVPLEPGFAQTLRLADLIVTESALGDRAVERCHDEAGVDRRALIERIDPLVTVDAGDTPSSPDRHRLRRELFGLDDDHLLIACEASERPAPALALQIFRFFADGLYWNCAACGRVTPFHLGEALEPIAVRACHRCGSSEGEQGRPEPMARLSVAGVPLHRASHTPGSIEWTTDDARRALGLEGRAFLAGDAGPHAFDPERSAVDRLRCADIHLAPHPLADADPSVLIGCALGVPAIVPEFGALAERLGDAVRLVPPAVHLHTSRSHVMALMDVAHALEALRSLARDGDTRAEAGRAARARLAAWTPAEVMDRWMQAIERMVTR
jgi:hypothetical protein